MKTMRERFNEKFIKHRVIHGGDKYPRLESIETTNELLEFIEQEIKKEREEIVEWIEKQDWECFEQTFITKDIINTIKNKHDKQ